MLSTKRQLARLLMLGLALALQFSLGCAPDTGTHLDSSDQGIHRLTDEVWDWFQTHTFNHKDFVSGDEATFMQDPGTLRESLSKLLSNKGDQTIALGVPLIITEAPNEPGAEDFERVEVPQMLLAGMMLKHIGLIDTIYFVHGTPGHTFDVVKNMKTGADINFVFQPALDDTLPSDKMGVALEKAILEARQDNADIFVWVDPEVGFPRIQANFPLRFIYGVLGPLLADANIDFAKGYYEQSVEADPKNALVRTGGGRITELTVRPLLNVFYPELSGFVQPLCSEFAVRMNALPSRPFHINGGGPTMHGAISGVMIDVLMKQGGRTPAPRLDALAQVNMAGRFAKNPGLPELSERSIGEADSIMVRAERDGRIAFASQWPDIVHARSGSSLPNRAMLRLKPVDPHPDPQEPIYQVTKEFETIPPNVPHAMDIASMRGWEMVSPANPEDQTRRTFSHWDFVEPETRADLKALTQAELDQRFNSGIDSNLIADAVQLLVQRKEELGLTISLGLPALNEGKTIAQGIRAVRPLVEAGLIDQFVVIDSDSIPLKRIDELTEMEKLAVREIDGTIATDPPGARLGSHPPPGYEHLRNKSIASYVSKSGTRERALAEGVEVVIHQQIDVHPTITSKRGKGEALWKSLKVLTGDIVAWIDTDITNPSPRFVYGLLGPLLFNEDIVYVKGFYERPISLGGIAKPTGGGRVTELMARPLLNYLYPELAGLTQPLSGEFAGRREALMQIGFFTGYGVESSMLIDLVSLYGRDALAQVDLEVRHHKNQDLQSLSKMAFGIADVILQRAAMHGRVSYPMAPNRGMWRLKPLPAGLSSDAPYIPFNAGAYEVINPDEMRPPMGNFAD
jgi:hypothetical protein